MFVCIIGLSTTTTTTTITTHKDFSGVWYRTKSVNLEAVLGASGAGFLLRKIAASLPITHTITMNPPILNTIRLQEKAGPVDFDNILTIDSTELKESMGNGKKMLQRIYWEGDSLILQRIFPNENFEMIISRTLDDRHGSDTINDNNSSHGDNDNSGSSSVSESKQLVSKIVHRHLKTGNEIEATSWFKYMSPSPNNPPIPDVITTIIEDNEDNNDNDDDSNNDMNKKKQIEEEVEAVVSKNTAVTLEINNDVAKTTSTITATNDGIDSNNKAVAPMSLVSSTIATTTDNKTTISSTTATATTATTTSTTAATTTTTAATAAKNRTSTLLPLPLSSQRYTPAIISRKMVNINHDYNEDDDDLTAVVKMRSFSSSVDFSTESVLSSSLLLLNDDNAHQKKPDFSGTWIREGFNISILMMMMTISSFHDYDFIYIHISRVSINHSIWLSDHSYHQS